MKNLIMFSLLHYNNDVHNFIKNNSKERNFKVGIIPAGTRFGKDRNIHEIETFKQYGFKEFLEFDIGYKYREYLKEELFDCDAIYIGGGNTFLLAYLLNMRNMYDFLIRYVKNGGILIGESAGSIVMCKTITIAGFADNNFLEEENVLNGLNLVDFEIKPHWSKKWSEIIHKFIEYQIDRNNEIYLLDNESVILVEDDEIDIVGNKLTVPKYDKEIFVGNTYKDEDLTLLTSNGVKLRMGNTAYDINGYVIKNDFIKPLFVSKDTYKLYNEIMEDDFKATKYDCHKRKFHLKEEFDEEDGSYE